MILPIRALKALSWGGLVDELLLGPTPNRSEPADRERDAAADESLQVLVKNAMRSEAAAEPDGERIWRRLSCRVRGPFGQVAVEGAANAAQPDIQAVVGQFALPEHGSPEHAEPAPPAQWSPEVAASSLYRRPNLGLSAL